MKYGNHKKTYPSALAPVELGISTLLCYHGLYLVCLTHLPHFTEMVLYQCVYFGNDLYVLVIASMTHFRIGKGCHKREENISQG